MEAVVVHAVPGRTRLRVRVRAELLSPARAERLADELTAATGITKVEINRRTGGILVSHVPTLGAADVAALAYTALSAMSDEAPAPAAGVPGITGIAREVHRMFVEADRDLREATDGMLDLGTATTLTLATAGALEVAVTQKLPVPPWFNLAWWSFRTFMTTIEDKVASAYGTPPSAGPPKGVEP